jgi:hypothetical protein
MMAGRPRWPMPVRRRTAPEQANANAGQTADRRPTLQWPRFAEEHRKIDCIAGVP